MINHEQYINLTRRNAFKNVMILVNIFISHLKIPEFFPDRDYIDIVM